MHRSLAFVVLLLSLCGAAARPVAAQTMWIVSAPPELDSRIKTELEDLARAHHARIKFEEANSQSKKIPRGALAITLKLQTDLAAFSEDLRKLFNNPATPISQAQAADGYRIDATATYLHGPEGISVYAASASGLHNALLRLPEILLLSRSKKQVEFWPAPKVRVIHETGRNNLLILGDFPSFPERGIVEGFYGKPWTHKQRLDMLKFEGEHAMNAYYYAPKDDPYHRKLWDQPYPPARMKQLGELVDAAHKNFVDFCFAISPGLSMTYSSPDDFKKLTDKLDSVSKLGVSCFALFLDDVPPVLENPQDAAKYKDLGAAHVDVINRLYAYLKSQSKQNRLVVTPTTYTNAWGSRDYIRELGEGVNLDIPMVWTGTAVVSPEITAAQAKEWGALIKRKPLVWDNFPVNDGIPWRVNLGPLRGRAPDLGEAVQGYFSNPMNQADASKIPLQTIADYLWNSEKYDPDASLKHALVDQYGPAAPRLLKNFLSTYGDYWWDENVFTPVFRERRYLFSPHEIQSRILILKRELAGLRANRRSAMLARELAPFPAQAQARLPKVTADPAFKRLPGEKMVWRIDYDNLQAARVPASFKLDGDFGKWKSGKIYTLDSREQVASGRLRWKGPDQFSARFALGWDESHLYIGVDVTDPDFYQPFRGRDVAKGDVIALYLETAFKKNFLATHAGADEYHLLFSPGDFQSVAPDVYSSEDYLPPRPVSHDYAKETQVVWRKTATGYSGDIALPASWFDGGKFSDGYEVGLVLGAQKVVAPPAGSSPDEDSIKAMTFRSKVDTIFPAGFGNPATYQRLVLETPKN